MTPRRISVNDAREKVRAGALLVAVTSQAGYDRVHLEDAISMAEFERRLPSLSKQQVLIFY